MNMPNPGVITSTRLSQHWYNTDAVDAMFAGSGGGGGDAPVVEALYVCTAGEVLLLGGELGGNWLGTFFTRGQAEAAGVVYNQYGTPQSAPPKTAFIAPNAENEQMVYCFSTSGTWDNETAYWQVWYFAELAAQFGGQVHSYNSSWILTAIDIKQKLIINHEDTGVAFDSQGQRLWITASSMPSIGGGSNVAVPSVNGQYPRVGDFVYSTHANSYAYLGRVDQVGRYGNSPYVLVRTAIIPPMPAADLSFAEVDFSSNLGSV